MISSQKTLCFGPPGACQRQRQAVLGRLWQSASVSPERPGIGGLASPGQSAAWASRVRYAPHDTRAAQPALQQRHCGNRTETKALQRLRAFARASSDDSVRAGGMPRTRGTAYVCDRARSQLVHCRSRSGLCAKKHAA